MTDYSIPFTVSDLCTFGPEQEFGIVQEILTEQMPDFAIVVLRITTPRPDAKGIHTRHIFISPKHAGGSRQHNSGDFPLTNITTGKVWSARTRAECWWCNWID